jgi:hypothetical protein
VGDFEDWARMAQAQLVEQEGTIHRLAAELAASQKARRIAVEALERVAKRTGTSHPSSVAYEAIDRIERDAAA